MSASITGTSEWTEASEEVGRYWKDKKTTVLYLSVVRFCIKHWNAVLAHAENLIKILYSQSCVFCNASA